MRAMTSTIATRTTSERTMHARTMIGSGSLLTLLLLLAATMPAGLSAQQSVLPAICAPGSGVSDATRRWCDRRREEGAVLPDVQGVPEPVGPLGGAPAPAASRADAGPVVPEAVLEEVPTLPRRSTDADAARRVRARVTAAMELPLERIRARTAALEGRAVAFRAQADRRASILVRSPEELLRQTTRESPPDLFELIRERRSRDPGR